uniref:DuqF n=1 Tax=Enterococcus durans TaxID=53345 RepID=F8WK41_9ENTE|nr:DuqF [Enterococcus durans]
MKIKKITDQQLKTVMGGSGTTILGKPATDVAKCLLSFFKKC